MKAGLPHFSVSSTWDDGVHDLSQVLENRLREVSGLAM
jgi:hypothetical protein